MFCRRVILIFPTVAVGNALIMYSKSWHLAPKSETGLPRESLKFALRHGKDPSVKVDLFRTSRKQPIVKLYQEIDALRNTPNLIEITR